MTGGRAATQICRGVSYNIIYREPVMEVGRGHHTSKYGTTSGTCIFFRRKSELLVNQGTEVLYRVKVNRSRSKSRLIEAWYILNNIDLQDFAW